MSRIRSIHPGLFTDDAFMAASLPARMLIIGLWVESWDDGVFEWKPLTLKARIFPVDTLSVDDLLEELCKLEFVKQFWANGKPYGAIRNFRKWQKPKFPNSSNVLPVELRKYVALDKTDSGSPTEDLPSPSPKVPQREEGGWRMEEGEKILQAQQPSIPAAAPADFKNDTEEVRRRCEQAAGREFPHFQTILTLVDSGVDLDRRILPIIRDVMEGCRRNGREPPTSWRYFEQPIMDSERVLKSAATTKVVSQALVKEGSIEWGALVAAGRKESLLREASAKHGGAWIASADIQAALAKFPSGGKPSDAERAA